MSFWLTRERGHETKTSRLVSYEVGWHEAEPETVSPSLISEHSLSKERVWIRCRLVFIRQVSVREKLICYGVSCQRGNLLHLIHSLVSIILQIILSNWFTSTYIASTPQEHASIIDFPFIFIVFTACDKIPFSIFDTSVSQIEFTCFIQKYIKLLLIGTKF